MPVDQVLANLSATPFPARYAAGTDRNLAAWVDDSDLRARRLVFGVSRMSGLPSTESGGNRGRLPIDARTGLLESIHVQFFDAGIVGADFNFHGPRLTQLASYLATKAPSLCSPALEFQPLISNDMVEKLRQHSDRGVHYVRLRVDPAHAGTVAMASRCLGAAINAAGRVQGSDMVEVAVHVTRRGDGNAATGRASLLRDLLTLLRLRRTRDVVDVLEVKVEDPDTGRQVVLDLLGDKLMAKKSMVAVEPRYRVVEALSAFGCIVEAYHELRPQLLAAAGLQG